MPYSGSTVSGSIPSRSATCSTTTSWTSAASSSSSRARSSIGQRCTTSRTCAIAFLDPGERDRVQVERVDRLGGRHVLDRELDLGELVAPTALEMLDRVEDEIVEALRTAAVARDRGQRQRAARTPSAAVAASASRARAVRPGLPVQRSEHVGQRRRRSVAASRCIGDTGRRAAPIQGGGPPEG